ncbi:hypothetical protein FRACYDRAFT_257639 [Fragilariopsis cylindrus CCMP1102]|uniref:DUF6824 domain-containing protein n=1 Tax=Fragilariopsis cylindrus CCMP1102 TaxID=635003 RepID=A0A1E7EJZ6_9STRA|nr:hypothetical protein FRACYDRAFT_257639 [Fragilariopsis cylindrus CCMP1102]|eukprot:OEU05873.1 hypothetical protein FRACYDRAFT_257639 [Fragilariopsis cylindrus CCMP1102]
MDAGTGFVAGADSTGGYLTHTYKEKKRKANDNGNLNMNKFSTALLNLSFNDRNQIEEEIHGVSCMSITERPVLIEVSLHQFDMELNLMPLENKSAYTKVLAQQDSSSYLLTKDMKLRFLRSELFDPSRSALRYSKYLNLLYEIFGECALKRPIRLQEDFNSDELSFFKSGAYQLLPFRDRCGRRIFAGVSSKKIPQKLLSKIWLYLFFVCIGGSDISNNDKNNLETQQKGNPIEILYKLQQFGIPIEHFPATDTGNIKLIYFKQWINLRTHLEYEQEKKINNNDNNNNNNIIIVECPLSNDVIFRRGKTMNFHSGNIKFQNLIESRICEYFINPNTSLSRRKEIEIDILNEVLNSCGRFLTWIAEKKWWLVIHSEDEMQFKIHYAFLGFRTRMLKKQQKQQKVVPTVAKLTSLFEGQQVGQKKKRYNNNNCSISSFSDCGFHCDSDDNNSNNSGNNNCSDCGYFFSVDDGSYACTDFS